MNTTHLFQLARTAQTDVDQLRLIADLLDISVSADQTILEELEPYILQVCDLSRDGEVSIEDAIERIKPTVPEFTQGSNSSPTQDHSDAGRTPTSAEEIESLVHQGTQRYRQTYIGQGVGYLTDYHQTISSDAAEMAHQLAAGPGLFWLEVAQNLKSLEAQEEVPFVRTLSASTSPITGTYDRRMLRPRPQNLLAG